MLISNERKKNSTVPVLEKGRLFFLGKYNDSINESNKLKELFKACVRYFLSNFYFFTKW